MALAKGHKAWSQALNDSSKGYCALENLPWAGCSAFGGFNVQPAGARFKLFKDWAFGGREQSARSNFFHPE